MIKLTEYQIAEAFQPILRHIYKSKMQELNEELSDVYAHLDRLDIPRYSDFDRWYARECLPDWAKDKFRQIYHINKIRRIKVDEMQSYQELDIAKARRFPIQTLYEFKRKGNMVSCPFHGEDKNPSMSLKYNRFYCFSCGAKGSTIDLIMRLQNIDFKSAVRQLCQ